MNPTIEPVPLLMALLATVVVFLIIRELVMWYWKINQRIELQTETNELLREIRDRLPEPEGSLIKDLED